VAGTEGRQGHSTEVSLVCCCPPHRGEAANTHGDVVAAARSLRMAAADCRGGPSAASHDDGLAVANVVCLRANREDGPVENTRGEATAAGVRPGGEPRSGPSWAIRDDGG
jgi:hypothetical protein